MHRKFIALIVATAIGITGISASRAKAADAHDILGGLAAIAIIGAAVNQYNKNKKEDRSQSVTRYYDNRYDRHHYDDNNLDRRSRDRRHARPIPGHVARYDLPQRCLRTFNGYGSNRPVLGQRCLNKHYKHARKLPESCKVGFWNGQHVRHAYEPSCLRQQGYRVVQYR